MLLWSIDISMAALSAVDELADEHPARSVTEAIKANAYGLLFMWEF
jgi:hypothetical protein